MLGQIAAALQQLTELQCLVMYGLESDELDTETTSRSVEGVKAFVQAVGGLKMLGEVSVYVPSRLQEAAEQQLECWLQQSLPSKLARGYCGSGETFVIQLHTMFLGKQEWGAFQDEIW